MDFTLAIVTRAGRSQSLGASRSKSMAAAFGAVLAFLLLAVLARPIDHDEGQYVAATILARTLLPYRDFDYLQTPLQPLLFAPLLGLWPQRSIALLRVLNAGLIAASVALSYGSMRRVGADRRRAISLCALMLCCEPLLFVASVARNDALPCFFLSAAIWTMTGGSMRERPDVVRRLAIGFLLASAAIAKLSYAIPCASLMLAEPLLCRRRGGLAGTAWLAIGALPPTIAAGMLALPSFPRFWFDVVLFPMAAPAEWYVEIASAWRLSGMGRSLDFANFLCKGPAAVMLVAVTIAALRRRSAGQRCPLALRLDVLIVAGVAAAFLPVPEWRQYLVPILPPLFVRAAMLEPIASLLSTRRCVVLAPFVLAGLAPTALGFRTALSNGSPIVRLEQEADQLGDALRRLGVAGPVATLFPERVADAGLALDPRFASGPFLFRTRDGLGRGAALIGVTRSSLSASFDARPPAAIITGGGQGVGAARLDALLYRWGERNDFRAAGAGVDGIMIQVPRRAGMQGPASRRSVEAGEP